MKKTAIILILITITSCKEKAKEVVTNKTPDEMVKEAAIPYIAAEISELDMNVIIARDTTKNKIYRGIAIDKIRHNESNYLYSATIENIFSRDFEERLENQKRLITATWRQIERNKQLKLVVIEQYKK